MKRLLVCIVSVAALLLSAQDMSAQFKSEAFSQTYNDDKATGKDSTDVLFSMPEFLGGLRHEREARIGTVFAGSTIMLGAQQIYNEDYWKLPLVYGSILGSAAAGFYLNKTGHQQAAKYCFIGTGVSYWATLMDGAVNYQPAPYPHAGKATIMSLLCPGLGQAYNGEYWKIPIYCGGLVACLYYYNYNTINFERFRRIYIEATDTEVPYSGPITAETALYYRNIYRTYRDYSIVALILVYAIQVIDANVFAYMHDFEVTDDIALSVSPTVITPSNQFAMNASNPAFGMRFGITF